MQGNSHRNTLPPEAVQEESATRPVRTPRRRFVQEVVALAALPWLSSCALAGGAGSGQQGGLAAEKPGGAEALDQALEMLADAGPEYAGGLANHGPMAAEALVAMGRPGAVVPYLERYKRRLQDHPPAGRPIRQEAWREALGDFTRAADWAAFFRRELGEAPWRAVLDRWAERLAPRLAAAATHGLLRTAHAARGLMARETELRKRELAAGLGYWAARYQILPASRDAAALRLMPSEAIKRVELLPVEQRSRGLIADALRRLDGFAPFEKVIGLVEVSGDAGRFLSDLTETAARAYLTNAGQRGLFAFVHGVTAASALRLLLPHVKPEVAPTLLRYGWQTVAAIYAAFATQPVATELKATPVDRQELINRAIATDDEHGIKFTEACLREYAANPSPVYLLAARDAVSRMGA